MLHFEVFVFFSHQSQLLFEVPSPFLLAFTKRSLGRSILCSSSLIQSLAIFLAMVRYRTTLTLEVCDFSPVEALLSETLMSSMIISEAMSEGEVSGTHEFG